MKVFAVFGDPISHSISPRLHNKAILDMGLDALYTRVHLKDGKELIDKFKELRLDGANVTVPHKEIALNLSDEVSETAKNIGSANTLVQKNGKIYAYNTDALGFLNSIRDFKDIKTALIIGAGGTAKAIAYILKQNNIDVNLLNRSEARLLKFKDEFECFNWDNFNPKGYDIVINSTSAGLKDSELPAPSEILTHILKHSKFGFDVIYTKQTPFLTLAMQNGLVCKDGKDMLLFQAVLAFNLFFNQMLDEAKIEVSMREILR